MGTRFVAGRDLTIGTDEEDESGRKVVVEYAEGTEVPDAETIPTLAGLLLNGYLVALDDEDKDVSEEVRADLLAAETIEALEELANEGEGGDAE